jgi:hypothetical protein
MTQGLPAFASGGNPYQNQWNLVGERGPEMFMPAGANSAGALNLRLKSAADAAISRNKQWMDAGLLTQGNYLNSLGYWGTARTTQAAQGWANLPGFAGGGDPPMNKPSIIGERGPELFMPKQAGTVIPNNKLQQIMGGQDSTPVVHLHDYTSTESKISGPHSGVDGSMHYVLRDAVTAAMHDPKVRSATNQAHGTKSRGYNRG